MSSDQQVNQRRLSLGGTGRRPLSSSRPAPSVAPSHPLEPAPLRRELQVSERELAEVASEIEQNGHAPVILIAPGTTGDHALDHELLRRVSACLSVDQRASPPTQFLGHVDLTIDLDAGAAAVLPASRLGLEVQDEPILADNSWLDDTLQQMVDVAVIRSGGPLRAARAAVDLYRFEPGNGLPAPGLNLGLTPDERNFDCLTIVAAIEDHGTIDVEVLVARDRSWLRTLDDLGFGDVIKKHRLDKWSLMVDQKRVGLLINDVRRKGDDDTFPFCTILVLRLLYS